MPPPQTPPPTSPIDLLYHFFSYLPLQSHAAVPQTSIPPPLHLHLVQFILSLSPPLTLTLDGCTLIQFSTKINCQYYPTVAVVLFVDTAALEYHVTPLIVMSVISWRAPRAKLRPLP